MKKRLVRQLIVAGVAAAFLGSAFALDFEIPTLTGPSSVSIQVTTPGR